MKIFLIVFLILIFFILVFILIKMMLKIKNDTQSSSAKTINLEQKKAKSIGIRDLLEVVIDNNLSKNELFVLCDSFLKLTIPAKKNGETPMEAKEYLDFILLIASHKNADAKIISHLNSGAKRRNPSYVVDIDNYEKNGLEQRKNHR